MRIHRLEFAYDGFGRRVLTRVNGEGLKYVYDGYNIVQERKERTDELVAEYTYYRGSVIKQKRGTEERWVYTHPEGGWPRHLFGVDGEKTDSLEWSWMGDLVFHIYPEGRAATKVDFGWAGGWIFAYNTDMPFIMMPESNEVWMPRVGKSLNTMARKSFALNFYGGTRGGESGSGCCGANVSVDPDTGICTETTNRVPARTTFVGQQKTLRLIRSANVAMIDPGDHDESLRFRKCCEEEGDCPGPQVIPVVHKRHKGKSGSGQVGTNLCGPGSCCYQVWSGANNTSQGCPYTDPRGNWFNTCIEEMPKSQVEKAFDCIPCKNEFAQGGPYSQDDDPRNPKYRVRGNFQLIKCLILAESRGDKSAVGPEIPDSNGDRAKGCFQTTGETAKWCFEEIKKWNQDCVKAVLGELYAKFNSITSDAEKASFIQDNALAGLLCFFAIFCSHPSKMFGGGYEVWARCNPNYDQHSGNIFHCCMECCDDSDLPAFKTSSSPSSSTHGGYA